MPSAGEIEYRGWLADDCDYRVVCIDPTDSSEVHFAIEGDDSPAVDDDPDEVYGMSVKVVNKDGEDSGWVCLGESAVQELFDKLKFAYASRAADGRAPTS